MELLLLALVGIGIVFSVAIWFQVRRTRTRFSPDPLKDKWAAGGVARGAGPADLTKVRRTFATDSGRGREPWVAGSDGELPPQDARPRDDGMFPRYAPAADALTSILILLQNGDMFRLLKHSIEDFAVVQGRLFSAEDVITPDAHVHAVAAPLHVKDSALASLHDTAVAHGDSVADGWTAPGFSIPFFTLGTELVRNMRLVLDECTSLDRAVGNIAVTTFAVGAGVTIGKFVGATLGLALLGPLALIPMGLAGAVAGGYGGRQVANEFRNRHLVSAQNRLQEALGTTRTTAQTMMSQHRQAAEQAWKDVRLQIGQIERRLQGEMNAEVAKCRQRWGLAEAAFCERFPAHLEARVERLTKSHAEWRRARVEAWYQLLWPGKALAERIVMAGAVRRARATLCAEKARYAAEPNASTEQRWAWIGAFLERYPTAAPDILHDVQGMNELRGELARHLEQIRSRLRADAERVREQLVATYQATRGAADRSFSARMTTLTRELARLRDDVRREARAIGLQLA